MSLITLYVYGFFYVASIPTTRWRSYLRCWGRKGSVSTGWTRWYRDPRLPSDRETLCRWSTGGTKSQNDSSIILIYSMYIHRYIYCIAPFLNSKTYYSPSRAALTCAVSSSRLHSHPSFSFDPRHPQSLENLDPRRLALACTASPLMAGTGWAGRPSSGAMPVEEEGASGRRRQQTDHCRESKVSLYENHSSSLGKTSKTYQRWWLNCEHERVPEESAFFCNESFHMYKCKTERNRGKALKVCFFSPEIQRHDWCGSTSVKLFKFFKQWRIGMFSLFSEAWWINILTGCFILKGSIVLFMPDCALYSLWAVSKMQLRHCAATCFLGVVQRLSLMLCG